MNRAQHFLRVSLVLEKVR